MASLRKLILPVLVTWLALTGVTTGLSPAFAGQHRAAAAAAAIGRSDGVRSDGVRSGVVRADGSSDAGSKGYTYWGYYRWNPQKATWDYMTVGANDTKQLPQTGDVYGFRWALVVKQPRVPRAPGSFKAICGGTDATGDTKRVAFVVDYGTPADAVGSDEPPKPVGLCAAVSPSFTVQQALETVTAVRTGSSGLVCGIGDYPSHGCGGVFTNAQEPPADTKVTLQLPSDTSSTASATPGGTASPGSAGGATSSADSSNTGSSASPGNAGSSSSSSSVSPVLWVVIGLIVVLAVAALVLRRRRS